MSKMRIETGGIDKIEKRMWQLILLAIAIILLLTLTLLALQFLGFLDKTKSIIFSDHAYKYSVSLAVLVLLFCSYMITQQRKLSHITRAFLKEKETAYTLSQNVTTLRALLEVSSVINSQQRLSDILNIIAQEILVCFKADQSSIMLLDPHSKLLKTEAAFGKGSEFAKDALVPMGESVAGWVVKNDKPLLLNGQADAVEFPGTQEKNRRISSAMCVPLKIDNKSIGVLNVNLVDRDRTFSEAHLKLIGIFANNAAVAISNSMLSKEKTERVRLQTMFEQFHSPQVVEELIKKTHDWDRPNRMREKLEMTILFADIRGFGNMMTALKLEEIMTFLDEYYSAMTKTVFNNQGSIDKFIGDEVMAFFGAPIALDNSSESGIKTAVEMVNSFRDLKEQFSGVPSFEGLGIGVGVSTGEVFVGNVGSRTRYDYTVIGSAVNLARRLCSFAESDQIITTERTIDEMDRKVSSEFVKNLSFKGILDPVNVHKITLGSEMSKITLGLPKRLPFQNHRSDKDMENWNKGTRPHKSEDKSLKLGTKTKG